MAARLGLSAKLYRLSTGSRASWGAADSNGLAAAAAPSNLDEIINVKDLTWSSSDTEAETNVRGNNGYASSLPALTTVEVNFDMQYDPADADFLALIKAKIGKTSVACAVLDGDKATVGNIGFWADFHVFTTEKSENLEEGQIMSFTLKPALTSVAPEWVKVTA